MNGNTSSINQQMHLYNFHLKHFKTLSDRQGVSSFVAKKNELNHEYVITLARNDETPWWLSEKFETCRSGFKCFKVL